MTNIFKDHLCIKRLQHFQNHNYKINLTPIKHQNRKTNIYSKMITLIEVLVFFGQFSNVITKVLNVMMLMSLEGE